ncbi:MAG: hypothetical protein Q4P13_07600, partial [Psychrobacter sp.]|nr:hypothetical protein [Psychrobacter sp.]
MATIIVKTHHQNQSETVVKLMTEQPQVPVIKANSYTQYELINEATGLAPAKAVIRRVGNDMEISFDEFSRDTDLIIEDYYSHTNQAIIGQIDEGKYLNYLPVTGETNAYTTQILNPDAYNPLLVTESDHSPFWATLGLENPWWLAAGIVPIVILASRGSDDDDKDNKDKDSGNKVPVLTVTQITGFTEKDADAKAGALVAKYTTSDADKDKVSVTLSDKTNYALDDKGNVTLTQKGAELVASGQPLPAFTLTPNDGKSDGAKASINPMVNSKLTVSVSDVKDFIEDGAATVKGAIVAKYKVEGDDSAKATVILSDTINYGFDDKGNIVLTEKGAALANSGKELPAFTLTPQTGMQAGQPTSVDPKVTMVNDAPVLTVSETTVFVQTDKNIKAGNIVAKYTVADEDGDTTSVILSDTEHYKLDNKGNVLLTQKGVDLISSGAELPPFKLTPNDSIVNGSPVLVGPEINSAPLLTITKTNDLTNTDAEVKAGAIVASFKTTDVDSLSVTVKLSDETNYALDGKGNVILTEKGAALVNGDKPLPEFTLTPNDAAQDGTDVTVNPNGSDSAASTSSTLMAFSETFSESLPEH